MLARTVLVAVGVGVGLWATSASAQTAPAAGETAAQTPAPPTDEARAQARERFRAGRDAFTAQNWETALAEFRAANELIPANKALSYIGQCLANLNRPVEALETFQQYLQLYGNPTTDNERTALEEVRGFIDGLEESIGFLQINVAVSGATILVDGQVVGTAPLGREIGLPRGPHLLRAEAPGHRPAEETVAVEGGQHATATLVPSPERTTAAVSLSSNVPGALASLDGESLGPLPYSGEVPPGVHQLEVTAEGYETARVAITLEAGQPFQRAIDLAPAASEDEPWYEKWWVWTIAGLVVGGAAAGIALGTTGGETLPDSTWDVSLP